MWMPPLKTDSGNITAQQAVLQIKIVLLGTRPPIWRRLFVPADSTLAELHDVIQAAMNWEESHLREFRIGRQSFGAPSMSGPSINEKKACLANVLNKVGSKATYIYDFGDSWEHAITVEKILSGEPNVAYPLCTDGKLAGLRKTVAESPVSITCWRSSPIRTTKVTRICGTGLRASIPKRSPWRPSTKDCEKSFALHLNRSAQLLRNQNLLCSYQAPGIYIPCFRSSKLRSNRPFANSTSEFGLTKKCRWN